MSRARLFHNPNQPMPRSGSSIPTAVHCSLNVNGLNKGVKQSQLNSLRRFHAWKVLYLNDTRIYRLEEIPKLEKSLGVQTGFWSLGSPHSAGTAILFFMPVNVVYSFADPLGRFTRVDYIWEDEEYSSVSIYAPAVPRDRKDFLATELPRLLAQRPLPLRTFIVGDWNFVCDPALDRRSTNSAGGQVGKDEFLELSEEHDLSDLFRHYHPAAKAFTFSSSQHNMSTRLDRCYANKSAVPFTGDCKHVSLPSSISDHEAGVSFTVRAINCITRGPGYWKLNTSLLKRPGYHKLVSKIIMEYKSVRHFYPDIKTWWESLKYALRLESEPYAKEQAARRKRTVQSLEKQLQQINVDMCSQLAVSNTDNHLRKEKLSLMLADYYQDIHDAARLKAGAKHASQGEKPTAYFTALVKARAQKSVISEIVSCDGSRTINDIQGILTEATQFYSRLYQAKNTDEGPLRANFLAAVDTTLSLEDRTLCERTITKSEVQSCLRKLSNSKCPGIDGLPVEFYKLFWPQLSDAYMDLLNECFQTKELPLTMRTSIITLIYKKGERTSLSNYRPISLLCADYKLIAKVLAERMKLVVHSIVDDDQTGFVPGRNINENIITFLEVQEHMHNSESSGFAFLADIEKAFDSVCRDFLLASLETLGFGPYFISWFQTLHNNSIARLTINGHLSAAFDICSGVRQGCPWAPLLFLVATEPFACNVRKTGIGINIAGTKVSYKGYADDTCCYVSSVVELQVLLNLFEAYRATSGLKLNALKSSVIPLGAATGMPPPRDITCKWLIPGEHASVLGIEVGSLYNDDISWNEMVKKFHRAVRQWSPKYLTVYGRICAAKAYIASKSWYLASVIPPLPKVVGKINAILWNFIQNNKCLDEDAGTNHYFSRWSMQTLRQPISAGGLNAQQYDFQLAALHSKWIKLLLDPYVKASWKTFPDINLMDLKLDRSLFICHRSVLSLKAIPARWKSYLEGWFAEGFLVEAPPKDYECLLNESLWFNRFILKKDGKPFGHYLSFANMVLQGGPFHVHDIVTKSEFHSKLRFLNHDELRSRFGATVAKVVLDIIKCVPIGWRLLIADKVREPFQINDWIIERKHAKLPFPPHAFKISSCIPGKVIGTKYIIDNAIVSMDAPLAVCTLSKAHAVKASVMRITHNGKSIVPSLTNESLAYSGCYSTAKLLLHRISWLSPRGRIPFSSFSIRTRYESIRAAHDTSIAACSRWNMRLNADLDWLSHFKYINDPILNNKNREFLYKLYTRSCMTGLRVKKFGHSQSCAHCDQDEDELHLFIQCREVQCVWAWFKNVVQTVLPQLDQAQLNDASLLFGYHANLPPNLTKAWKLFHVETIRAIWLARNRKLFDDKMPILAEMITNIHLRMQQSIQIHHYNLQISSSKGRRHRCNEFIRLWTSLAPFCTLDAKGRLVLRQSIFEY